MFAVTLFNHEIHGIHERSTIALGNTNLHSSTLMEHDQRRLAKISVPLCTSGFAARFCRCQAGKPDVRACFSVVPIFCDFVVSKIRLR